MSIMQSSQLYRWSDEATDDAYDFTDDELCQLSGHMPVHSNPIFSNNGQLSSKIALWQGDMLKLNVDAIVHPTNERFERLTPLTDRLYRESGLKLKSRLFNKIKFCKTGNVKITKGYSITPQYIIHTASPVYKRKFQSATEHALFSCYLNVLSMAKHYNLRTIALCPIAIKCHNFPEFDANNIGIRVIRRFMERFPDAFDLVVLAVEDTKTYQLYNFLLKLYFPRNPSEERMERYLLPKNCGGSLGQPIVPGREIRIKENPIKKLQSSQEWNDSCFDEESQNSICSSLISCTSELSDKEDCRERLMQLHYHDTTEVRDRAKSFLSVRSRQNSESDFFSDCSESSSTTDLALMQEFQRQFKFERLSRKFQLENRCNRNSIETILNKCIYISGFDKESRPILTIIGHRFLYESMANDCTMSYILNLLEKISRQEYVVCYYHTLVDRTNIPNTTFIERINEYLSYRHRKNLKTFYFVHPSVWCRMYIWWYRMFNFKFLDQKVKFVNKLDELKNNLTEDFKQNLPPFIQQYDS